MSAAHIALWSDDILHEIFEWLTPPLEHPCLRHSRCATSPKPEYQRTLCLAARVCKAFSRPALKLLWTNVSTIDALFCILSSSLHIVSGITGIDTRNNNRTALQASCWVVDGPLSEKECERFVWYSQFIRTIHLRSSYNVDPRVFLHLSHEHLGTPVVPQLHSIYCERDQPYLDMAVRLLSGPALRNLRLVFSEPDPTIDDDLKLILKTNNYGLEPLLQHVYATAPNLEKLAVDAYTKEPFLYRISAMKQLRVLDISMISSSLNVELLRALSTLDQLEELSICNSFVGRNVTPCKGFKNVKKLIIYGGISSISNMFTALPDLCLKELRMTSCIAPFLSDLRSLVSSLSQGSRHSLERVRIDDLSSARFVASAAAVIDIFLDLANIRSFVLNTIKPVDIANEDLRALGSAWPKLTELRLQYGTSNIRTIAAPTIRGIIELANACPELNDVYFSSVVPSLASGWEDGMSSHKSEDVHNTGLDVHVDDEDIRDERQVARVLWSVFGEVRVAKLDRTRFAKWTAVMDEVIRLQDAKGNKYRV